MSIKNTFSKSESSSVKFPIFFSTDFPTYCPPMLHLKGHILFIKPNNLKIFTIFGIMSDQQKWLEKTTLKLSNDKPAPPLAFGRSLPLGHFESSKSRHLRGVVYSTKTRVLEKEISSIYWNRISIFKKLFFNRLLYTWPFRGGCQGGGLTYRWWDIYR